MGKTQLAVFFAAAILSGCRSSRPVPPPSASSIDDCVRTVSARYKGKRLDPVQQRQYQTELANCIAPELSPAQAACVGAVQADYTELARQLARGTLTPAQWLQRSRDRTGKLNRFLKDPAWSAMVLERDVDQDLVPDAEDRCPNTPRLAATDATGCPLAEPAVSEGPSPQEMRHLLEMRVLLPNRRCADAPTPMVPTLLEAASVDWPGGSRPRLRLDLEEITNQPAECPVVYEVVIEEIVPLRLDDPAQPPRQPEQLTMVLNPAIARRTAGPPARLIFEKEHAKMTFFFHQGCNVKVRAINGGGSLSPWSQKTRVLQR
jgi:hypothetical protein